MKIGLEVHVQLLTKSKLFCGCANRFVNEPNTLTCEYCTGMPGSKPRLNAAAVEAAMKIGLALSCKFPKETFFSRKSYFYPDMGKNFQITQYEIPIAAKGSLKVGKKKIRIRRIQMEEDPARIVHIGEITQADYVLVDYNRSGVPLCEIVTEPDFRDPKEARIFLQELASILQYLNVFNPYVEGSMRVDANVSVPGGERVEVKNISGFKEVERALNYELVRQRGVQRRGGAIVQETRGWDAAGGVTRSLRLKEGEDDYGYIFEGDLPRISVSKKKLKELKKHLPEFSQQKVRRYVKLGVGEPLAESIASDPDLAEAFELVKDAVSVPLAASWFAGELKKTLNYSGVRLRDTRIKPDHIARLLAKIEKKEITERSAELLLREMMGPVDPESLLREKDVSMISDEESIESIVTDVIEANARAVEDYKTGKKETLNFLVGQVMRRTQGRADQSVVRDVLERRLG